MCPEGDTEFAPPWVKPGLGAWSAEPTQPFQLKRRDHLPHPLVFLYLSTSPDPVS